MRPQGLTLISITMNANNKIQTAGDCINEALFWLEGTVDGTCETREEILAILAQSICALQAAYTRMLFDTDKVVGSGKGD